MTSDYFSQNSILQTLGAATALGLMITAAGPVAADGFEDVSDRLDGFVHQSLGLGGEGVAGAAWFDFDGDGHLDLFLTNGKGSPNALFRNNGDGTFTEVGAATGVADTMGHSGVVAADIDNDGFPDLFLAGEGHYNTTQTPTVLYYNNGDGTFTNAAPEAGLTRQGFWMSATLGDYDGDGNIDIFSTNVGGRSATPAFCTATTATAPSPT